MAIQIESKYNINGYIESLIGGRNENQDSASFKDVPLGSIIVVCDGMGGGPGGSTASHLAVQTIIDDLSEVSELDNPIDALRTAIIHANDVIRATCVEYPHLRGMGTTVTAVLISPASAIVAHIGDSRAYQLRGQSKIFRTWDHSMVFQLVKQKLITEEDARNHPQSNVILSALGIADNVEPEIEELSYNAGDRFVLCTDGFWAAQPEKDFLELVTMSGELQEVTESCAKIINGVGIRNGGYHDNLTAAIIDVQCDSKLKPKMRKNQIIALTVILIILLVSIVMNFFTCRFIVSTNEKVGISEVLKGEILTDTIMSNDSVTEINSEL